ncbi:TadE family protein [Microbacterium sp. LRZ72]|uniref:TadE family protein n=1 Tax=Microbacterium sp. LRZ72 TaxID=2942481 RepID=UPI0029A78560|nr:TadE family protein [Microbacterium sp. LRZ72]MDX2377905.1 TadE family protein [Microbacterium sp. LRZ72]
MPPSRACSSGAAAGPRDDGSASLEFIAVGLVLLVPLVYLIVALGQIQEQALGTASVSRHVVRAIAQAPDAGTAEVRAQQALRSTAAQYGMEPRDIDMTVTCVPRVPACPAAGTVVVVEAAAAVRLPLVPAVLGLDRLAQIVVESSAVQRTSRFWGNG